MPGCNSFVFNNSDAARCLEYASATHTTDIGALAKLSLKAPGSPLYFVYEIIRIGLPHQALTHAAPLYQILTGHPRRGGSLVCACLCRERVLLHGEQVPPRDGLRLTGGSV